MLNWASGKATPTEIILPQLHRFAPLICETPLIRRPKIRSSPRQTNGYSPFVATFLLPSLGHFTWLSPAKANAGTEGKLAIPLHNNMKMC